MKKIIILAILFVFLATLVVGLNTLMKEDMSNGSGLDSKEVPLVFPDLNENMTPAEMRKIVYETYKNSNIQISAVVENIFADSLVVKTFEAGSGTESVVKQRTIRVVGYVPVIESRISLLEERDEIEDVQKKTIIALKPGDRITIECAERKSLKESEELTAVFITKETVAEAEGLITPRVVR